MRLDISKLAAILVAEIDRAQIVRGKVDLDLVGHYPRPDIFELHVDERPKQPVTTSGGNQEGKEKARGKPSRHSASGSAD